MMERLFNGVFLTSLTYQQMADWHDVLASRIILLFHFASPALRHKRSQLRCVIVFHVVK